MEPPLERLYGGKVRIRICGICWQENRLLLVNHRGLSAGDFWAPPGGGLEFLEPADRCLQREFLEETGLDISVGRFMFACEFLNAPLHAIELFFEASFRGGALNKGNDPELPIIKDVRFMSANEIKSIPESQLHGIFRLISSANELKTLTGFFRI